MYHEVQNISEHIIDMVVQNRKSTNLLNTHCYFSIGSERWRL